MSGEWTHIRDRGNYWLILLTALIYKYGGRIIVTPILYGIVFYFYVTNANARRYSKMYLNRVKRFCEPSLLSGKGTWHHHISFGTSLLDRVAAWMGHVDINKLIFSNRQALIDTTFNGGTVILTAHFGNLEMARAMVDQGAATPLNIVIDTQRSESFNKLIKQLSPDANIRLISTHSLGPDTGVFLKQRLELGECVIIMADRVSATNKKRALKGQLLGGEVELPEGSFRLALALDRPIYFMCCTKEPKRRFKFHFHRLDVNLLGKNKKEKAQALSSRFLEKLESLCLEYPLQWFNFYDYWQEEKKSD